ncbi:hypothetical protein ScPMuIL_016230 [Solemya velum]
MLRSVWVLLSFLFLLLIQEGWGIMCHRCFSAMGGCGNDLDWRMFPWKDCGDSEFCVKVIQRVGSEDKIIRECENELLKSTRHRLQMPTLRRHGYCLNARKNDMWNREELESDDIQYCFCNDWNGCNSAPSTKVVLLPVACFSILVSYIFSKFF